MFLCIYLYRYTPIVVEKHLHLNGHDERGDCQGLSGGHADYGKQNYFLSAQ